MAQFKCITAKGVNYSKKYLGEGVLNYQDVRTTTLEIVFNNVDNDEELVKYYDEISVYNEIGGYGNFSIENLSFTNSRITNAEFPTSDDLTETGIGFGKVILTIETRSAGDTSHLDANAYYDAAGNLLLDQIESYGHLIENLSEDFSFVSGINGQIEFSRKINLQLIDTTDNSLSLAKTVAGDILQTTPNFGFEIPEMPGSLKTYKTETVNKITNEISISQVYTLFDNTGTTDGKSYTYELTHNITYSEEGLINVTEAGTIQGTSTDGDIFVQAREAVEDQIALSYARCVTIFQKYVDASIQANVALNTRAVDTSRAFNNINKQAIYTVSYTSNVSMHNGYVADRTISSSDDPQGLRTINENTTLTTFEPRGIDPITFYTVDKAGAYSRINDMLTQGSVNFIEGMVHTSTSVDYDPVGKVVTYSIEYTNSPALVTAENIDTISKIELEINDTAPIRMHSEYAIAGYKFLVQKGGQTELGKRKITIKALETRANGVWPLGTPYASNRIVNPAIDENVIDQLAAIAKEKALDVFQDLQIEKNDLFVADCKWGYDSNGNISFDVDVSFVGAAN